MTRLMTTTTLALMLTSAAAFAEAPVKAMGGVLTNTDGMTLYTFDKDADGVSNCTGDCAGVWPPFAAAADAVGDTEYTIIDRADGTKQWAYDGKPMYTFATDTKAGDMAGDGVKGVWHVIKAE
jgi:predicted lipoprotein with Yx(FWY)xxD motif